MITLNIIQRASSLVYTIYSWPVPTQRTTLYLDINLAAALRNIIYEKRTHGA